MPDKTKAQRLATARAAAAAAVARLDRDAEILKKMVRDVLGDAIGEASGEAVDAEQCTFDLIESGHDASRAIEVMIAELCGAEASEMFCHDTGAIQPPWTGLCPW